MRQVWIVFIIFFVSNIALLSAQNNDVLFKLNDLIIYKENVLNTLPTQQQTKDITTEQFNRTLNFYLSVHDFKEQKKDTTQSFKRKLETQMLGRLVSSFNYEKQHKATALANKLLPVVNDLFVPFEPILLREIEKRRKAHASFEEIANYALNYDGSLLKERVLLPTNFMLQDIATQLLRSKGKIIGAIKDTKGYHYFTLVREQKNFGKYKTQVIQIRANQNNAKENIEKAYLQIKNGSNFEKTALEYTTKGNSINRFIVPTVKSDNKIETELQKLTKDGQYSKPFFSNENWYILKRLAHKEYPRLQTNQRNKLFIEALKQDYTVTEFPQNFLSGRDEILFLVNTKPYYEKDFKNYLQEYGYKPTPTSYNHFLYHLIIGKYIESLDEKYYKNLLDDFYFMQIYTPILLYKQKKNGKFVENLRTLVKKYKPFIPNKKYVENNPVFKNE